MDKYYDGKMLFYGKIIANIGDFTKLIYNSNANNSDSSYYSIIKTYLKKAENKRLIPYGVATTNYFNFVETLCKNPIYLNGQLKYFEFPEVLEVHDLKEKRVLNDRIFFPFIFGQSLVKPLVNEKQIEEFYRVRKMLDDTDILIILGYSINEDDNHINSFLHSFAVNKTKRLIYVTDKTTAIDWKLRCQPEDVEYCEVKYDCNEKVLKEIFNKINTPKEESKK